MVACSSVFRDCYAASTSRRFAVCALTDMPKAHGVSLSRSGPQGIFLEKRAPQCSLLGGDQGSATRFQIFVTQFGIGFSQLGGLWASRTTGDLGPCLRPTAIFWAVTLPAHPARGARKALRSSRRLRFQREGFPRSYKARSKIEAVTTIPDESYPRPHRSWLDSFRNGIVCICQTASDHCFVAGEKRGISASSNWR
jgi:hypothetical protein